MDWSRPECKPSSSSLKATTEPLHHMPILHFLLGGNDVVTLEIWQETFYFYFRTIFTKSERHKFVDPDYSYTDGELTDRHAHRNKYINLFRELRDRRINKQKTKYVASCKVTTKHRREGQKRNILISSSLNILSWDFIASTYCFFSCFI